MTTESILKDKVVLIVDDEPDVLEALEEELDMCIISKAQDYNTAIQYLAGYNFDIVILDIMGVRGFELLKEAVSRGFPAVMLTAYAVSPESVKQSIKLGAVSFLPKDKIVELRSFLEDVVLGGGKPVWHKVFDKLDEYFKKRFGPDWEEKDQFFKELEKNLTESKDAQS